MEYVILDCDPGHDDAVAIMLLGKNKNIKLLGICVSSGNQIIAKTAKNAMFLVDYLDLDVPVAVGVSRPLVRKVEVCSEIHGESGLEGIEVKASKRKFAKLKSPNFMIEKILNFPEKVTIVVTGPLTNLALALRLEPKICQNIKKVVIMGGSYQMGNVSPASEFNIQCDPEAASIVLDSGLPVYFVTLDVTRKVLCLPSIIERMDKIKNKASALFVDLMRTFNSNQKKIFGYKGGPLHDPVTIATLIDPQLVTFKYVNTEIDLSHGPSYGRTNCDIFDYLHKEKNSFVSVDINIQRFWDIIEDGLRNY